MNIFRGIVQEGAKRAAALGYPTVNIPLRDTDVSGVYAARVRIEKKEYVAAVFADQKRKLLEAYLLDFAPRQLYGETVAIELHKKIRDTKEFDNDEALSEEIKRDIATVRRYFKK